MEEIWKDIPDYLGYQVSNLGRVRTHNKITYTKKSGERHWKDRILKPKGQTYATGYRVDLWKNGKPKSYLVARLVAFTFYEVDINNHELTVNHIDGNRFNNNIQNLELISLADNIRHAFDTGLMPYKRVKIFNKGNKTVQIYRSISSASIAIGKYKGYISFKIRNQIFEDKEYKWELIQE